MKRILIIAITILTATSVCLAQQNAEEEFKERASKLLSETKYSEYIKMMDEALTRFPDKRLEILQRKIEALDKLNLDKEAALVAEEIYYLTPEIGKRVLASAVLAWRHITCNDIENCYKWAKVSADLGYQKFNYYLDNEIFKPLQKDKRFNALIEQIKQNAGIGKPVEQFVCTDFQGKEVSLEKYKGSVVLVDFWATWCPPCIAEIPNLRKLQDEYKDKGFEIIGISFDSKKEQLDKFLLMNNLPWSNIRAEKGAEEEISKLFNTKLLPSCYLIDRKGILRYVQLKGDDLRNAVAELINE